MESERGFIRPIDRLGRICLPKELRKAMGLAEGDTLAVSSPEPDSILLQRYAPGCIFCGETGEGYTFMDRFICEECWDKLHGPVTDTEPSQKPEE